MWLVITTYHGVTQHQIDAAKSSTCYLDPPFGVEVVIVGPDAR